MNPPPVCIRDWIDRWADEKPDCIFLLNYDGASLTFGELRTACIGLCSKLSQRIEAGQNVAYAMHNSLASAQIILGCLYGGFVPVAVNLVSGRETIRYVLKHSGAKITFAQEATKYLVEEFVSVEVVHPKWFEATEQNFSPHHPSAESEGLLMYTSGTTGLPKGVVHTHKSLIAGGTNTKIAHKLKAQDRGLCSLPLYHINAFCVSLMGSLVAGGSLVVGNKFSTSSFWHLLRQFHCTWFSLVPTQISYLFQAAQKEEHDSTGLEQIRFGRSSSAPLSPDMHRNFEQCFNLPLIETMGITEAAAQILSNPPAGIRKIGSAGIAYGNEIRIGDKNLKTLPPQTQGEILVRGDNLMSHYHQDPKATKATIKNGWLRTGDLGRMDKEGYVFVSGRLKELIIKGGENIAPREIDDILYQHKDVIEAACFAAPCPNYGERVEAAVKLSEGSTLTAQDLIALCIEKIGSFKSPDAVYILSDLPKGPSGKIQRRLLAEMNLSS